MPSKLLGASGNCLILGGGHPTLHAMEYLDGDAAFAHHDESPGTLPRQRDGFITVLAICHFISGFWRLYLENRIFMTYLDMTAVGDPTAALWGPPIPMVVLGNVTIIFILAAGLGLLLNAQWGWWLTGFVYSYAVIQSLYILVMWYLTKVALQQQEVAFDLQPYFRNLGLYSFLLVYLQTNRVLKSFGLPLTSQFRWKSIAIRFSAAIAGIVITTLLSLFILTKFGRSVPYIEIPQ